VKPRGPITGASTAGWLKPLAAPLWLALQPYANARLCLFEVDRPESRSPVPICRHVIDCFLEQAGIVGGYLCRAAILPVSTSNTFDWLAAELPWDPTLLGTVQAPCQGVMWLGDLAQFAGCLVQPLLGEAIQLVLRPHSVLVLRDGDTLNLIAERYGTTLLLPGYLPSTPLPAGEWIYLPARRSAPAVEEGVESLQLLPCWH
jgi:hypothetical protein